MDKVSIIKLLKHDYHRLKSLKKLAFETGVSKAYLSQLINEKYDPGLSTWNRLANHYHNNGKSWEIVKTENIKRCNKVFDMAVKFKSFHVLIGDAGTGKTTGSKQYVLNHENAFLVTCEDFTQKHFVEAICNAMYIEPIGTKHNMIQLIKDKMAQTKDAVLILDEAGMLNDNCLTLLKPIWGDSESTNFGLVMLGVDYLEINIIKKVRKDKKGFIELYDRMNKPFIRMHKPSEKEIATICYVNGVHDDNLIDSAVNRCLEFGSFRRIQDVMIMNKL